MQLNKWQRKLRGYMKYLRRRVRELLLYSDYDVVELLIGLCAVLWGIWVGNPYWDAFVIAPHPKFLEVAPEWVWGAVIGTIGGIHVTAVTVNNPRVRRGVAFLALCAWLFIVSTFGAQRLYGPATSLYIMVTIAQAWVYLRFVRRTHITKDAAVREGLISSYAATQNKDG